MIGDQNPPNDNFTDETINATLALAGSVYGAAATLADSLAAKFSSQVDISVDGLSVSNGNRAAAYRALAARLRAQATAPGGIAGGGIGLPGVSGVSVADMAANAGNTDRPKSSFAIGMQDDLPPPYRSGPP